MRSFGFAGFWFYNNKSKKINYKIDKKVLTFRFIWCIIGRDTRLRRREKRIWCRKTAGRRFRDSAVGASRTRDDTYKYTPELTLREHILGAYGEPAVIRAGVV